MIDSVISLAELGYKVFPLIPGAKHPHGRLAPNGLKDATCDTDKIRAWHKSEPMANWGLVTDGFLVVDVDGEDNPWPGDPDRAAELAECGALAITGRNGRHFYFGQPVGKSWRNTAGRLGERVDTRSTGGYVVLAGSTVTNKGIAGVYQWIDGMELTVPADQLPHPPEWLMDVLDAAGAPGSRSNRMLDGKPGDVEILDGRRNHALTSIAGTMRRVGMGEPEILAALTEANAYRCKPPLDQSEVESIAASVSKYEPDQLAVDMITGALDHIDISGLTGESKDDASEFFNAQDLIDNPPEKPEIIIPNFLHRGGVGFLFGGSKTLKTFSCLEMCLQANIGGKWHTGKFSRPMKIVYCDGEVGKAWMADRLARISNIREIPNAKNIDMIFTRDMSRSESVNTIARRAKVFREMCVDLLVIDNLSKYYPAWDRFTENDNKQMMDVMMIYQKIARDANCAILIVHHTTKNFILTDNSNASDSGAGAGAIGRSHDGCMYLGKYEDNENGEHPTGWQFVSEPRNHPGVSFPITRENVLWVQSGVGCDDIDISGLTGETKQEKSEHGEAINYCLEKNRGKVIAEVNAKLLGSAPLSKFTIVKTIVNTLYNGKGTKSAIENRAVAHFNELVEHNEIVRVGSKSHGKTILYQMPGWVPDISNGYENKSNDLNTDDDLS